MIAPNLSMKLTGRHYESFRDFALRSGAKTTTENVKRLIETLPEHECLLNIHEATLSSNNVDSSVTESGCDRQVNNGSEGLIAQF